MLQAADDFMQYSYIPNNTVVAVPPLRITVDTFPMLT